MTDSPVAGAPVAGAKEVREEDAFDVAAVDAWLRATVNGFEARFASTSTSELPEVKQFSAGASNLTYLLRYPDRDLILRRPPSGSKAKSAHDMGREYRIQGALAPVFPQVAPMVGHCDDESVIGSEFYVMERVVGEIPGKDFNVELAAEQVRALCLNTFDLLAALHAVDPAEAGLDVLDKGPGYVARQVGGWSSRFRKAITPDVPDLEEVMGWLDAHQPDDVRRCLIHNDFRLDNIVYDAADPTVPIGLLDWEMATVGDPLMDLGCTMAYWIQGDDDEMLQLTRMQPSNADGMLTRSEVVAYYCEKAGLSVTPEQWLFYEVFGLFRLAVIAQQIYYRFFHGQTTNPKFAPFGILVDMLDQRCRALIGAAS
ncbi:phosphotransferase family protein [Nocardioides humilatus]|uniref:Phosphotransferase family protein n=1 Tax=Nocardioides humilatus TaxID=2607660 RepID=A0A5B1LGZ8_9ACTN|nr:phosphotransferase family protein [Nocardioides humilatus]KAA1418907.1 phosphotransferase family protein [Nocardioides humilatus]